MRLQNILLCGLLVVGCEGSLLQCSSDNAASGWNGTWLGATLTIARFDEAASRAVPEHWAGVNADFESQPGFQRHALYAATNAEYPYVSFGVWDSASAAESAHGAVAVPEVAAPTVGHYEMVEHRGDVREAGTCLTIISVEDDGEDQAERFRTASEWFGQKPGFVGSVLLRRTSGEGAPFTIISRWSSQEMLQAVSADSDLPLHIAGSGRLGVYLPAS